MQVEPQVALPNILLARYYSNSVGRFLSVDPLNGAPPDPQSWNRFSYVRSNPLNRIDPDGAEDITPWQAGWEWASGTGPTYRTFTSADRMTQSLMSHKYIKGARELMRVQLETHGTAAFVSTRYGLDGFRGVPKYVGDYSTLATGGMTGNLTVTFLGSYAVRISVVGWDEDTGTYTVQFIVTNVSSLQSAIRPPVIGYMRLWQTTIGAFLNNLVSVGPMSATEQEFQWTEQLEAAPPGDCRGHDPSAPKQPDPLY